MSSANRLRAIALYKELHRLGRDYPNPSYDFHGKLRRLFARSATMKDQAEIERFFKLAEYIREETLSLYALQKYRHLKRQGH